MEIRTIGPFTGAEARANRQPPTAANAVARTTRPMMNVYRNGRDNLLQPVDGRLRQRSLRRRGVDSDGARQVILGCSLVSLVNCAHAHFVERFAPRRIGG